MIVSEFILLKIEREVMLCDTVAFQVVLLGKAPESFDAVNMGAAFHIGALMSNDAMFAIRMQVIVALPFIAVKDGTFDGKRSNPGHEGLFGKIGHHHAVNTPRSLQKPENNDFSGGAPPSPAFAMAAKIGFVDLDLSKQFLPLQLRHFQDRTPESTEACISSAVGHADATPGMMRACSQAKSFQELPFNLSIMVTPFAPAVRALLLPCGALMGRHMASPTKLAKHVPFIFFCGHRLTFR